MKVEPRPTSLATLMSPPIRRQKRREMASPRPVPPYLLAVEASAWLNASNSRSSCSGVMPIPVSLTRKTMVSPPPASRRASRLIVPRSVNLLAFDSRLNSTWRVRVRSACIVPSASAQRIASELPFFSTSGRTVVATSPIVLQTSKLSR